MKIEILVNLELIEFDVQNKLIILILIEKKMKEFLNILYDKIHFFLKFYF